MRKHRLALVMLLVLPAAAVRSGEGEVRLLTDDAIPRYLARGQELAKAEKWEKMVDVLQRVVIGDPEVFPDLTKDVLNSAVYSSDDVLFYPARELCLRELSKLPPKGLRAYRSLFDRDAKEMYKKAKAVAGIQQRLLALSLVFDRYLVSSVGDDALRDAGDLNLALGRFYEALAHYRRLVDVYPSDADVDLPDALAKAAYCAARIGDPETRDNLLDFLAANHADARVTIEGKRLSPQDLRNHPRFAIGGVRSARAREWPAAGGGASRLRVVDDLPETLARTPFWAFRLHERSPVLSARYGLWDYSSADRAPTDTTTASAPEWDSLAPYPAVRPIVVNGAVYYKDYRELIARYLGSGARHLLCGRYDPQSAVTEPGRLQPARFVRPGTGGTQKEEAEFENIYRFIDYGGSSVAAGAGRLIVIEPFGESSVPTFLRKTGDHKRLWRTQLISYDRATGKTTWLWDPEIEPKDLQHEPEAIERWRADVREHPAPWFRGPGVVRNGIVYCLAEEESRGTDRLGGVAVWALDARTGEVRFRTTLHQRDETPHRLPVGASLSVAGGVIYAVTGGGIVAAIDALPPGRIRWIRRYKRNYTQGWNRNVRRRWRGRGRRSGGQVKQRFAYNDPIVAGGRVIIAPPDGNALLALEAETGQEAWRIPRGDLGDPHHVVGVSGNILVVAGEKVAGIDIAKGKIAWGPHSLEGHAFGRGLVGRHFAYVPSNYAPERKSAIERFDLLTGRRAKPFEFDVERLGNLVYLDGRLIVANDNEIMCFTTAKAELARIDDRLSRPGGHEALFHERARIALASEPPLREQARRDFQRAIAATNDEATRNDLRDAAIRNLFRIALRKNDTEALDAALTMTKALALDPTTAAMGRAHPYEAQALYLRARILGRKGHGTDALDLLEQFLDKHGAGRVQDGDTIVRAPAAANKVRDALLASNAAFRKAFEQRVRARIDAAVKKGDLETLASLPERYGGRSPSEEALFALAAVHDKADRPALAELALRQFLRDHKGHSRAGEAHLRIALLLAKRGTMREARRMRDRGLSWLDEHGRTRLATLIAELNRHLPAGPPPATVPRLTLPLRATPAALAGAEPVQIRGRLPVELKGLALFANGRRYAAVDADGKVLWNRASPAGKGFSLSNEPASVPLAAEIAAARFAVIDGDDLLVGDIAGLMRLDATTGQVLWSYPPKREQASRQALDCLLLLKAYIEDKQASRSYPLPGYALAGKTIIRVHPSVGIEAFHAETGALAWQKIDVKGVPVGAPAVLGRLLAVGWADAGRVRVMSIDSGEVIADYRTGEKNGRPTRIWAPPVLDPLGRLYVVEETDGAVGRLRILNARRSLKPAHPRAFDVFHHTAMVLHADGRQLIYHDGTSVGEQGKNLHVLSLETGKTTSHHAGDLLRDVHVLRDGRQMFLFSHAYGQDDLGARLMRVNVESGSTLAYARPPRVFAYARPVLTKRYIVVAGSRAQAAHVRLFDREASQETRYPHAVFRAGDKPRSELNLEPGTNKTNYRVGTSVAAAGNELIVSTPFGIRRLKN